jgi:hypothetical protein
MRNLGNIAVGQSVSFLFSTNDGDGMSVAPATAGTVAVYKDDGTTETTAGVTYTPSFDAVVGINLVKIETSDAFYATGHDYTVVLRGAVIDGTDPINMVLAAFSIEHRQSTPTGFPAASYTAERAAKLDNLDATISSRSTYAGGGLPTIRTNIPPSLTLPASGSEQILIRVFFRNSAGEAVSPGGLDVTLNDSAGHSLLSRLTLPNEVSLGEINSYYTNSSTDPADILDISLRTMIDGIVQEWAGKVLLQAAPDNAGIAVLTALVAHGTFTADALANVPTVVDTEAIAQAVWALAAAIDGQTPQQALQIIAAVLAGKISGAGTGTETFVGLDGTTPRVQVATTPAGNRTNVVYP